MPTHPTQPATTVVAVPGKVLRGGVGGAGGPGQEAGGPGGLGEGPEMSTTFALAFPGEIAGGYGGMGGTGKQGGGGGVGAAPNLTGRFKGWQDMNVDAITTSIAAFCKQYKIEKVRERLEKAGYDTVVALFVEDLEEQLKAAGLTPAEIGHVINLAIHFIQANTAGSAKGKSSDGAKALSK
ncbi:hypothetical protein C8R46DRAFT_1034625 [Mycena filopes]|nr:hypothetical protein C8R46DRAFT_1034625 [Mycena filopes]